MKILAILPSDKKNNFNRRINIDFIAKLKNFCDYIPIEAYSRINGVLISAERLYSKYKPDVMICMAHNKFLYDYFKKSFPCVKVMIAVDFHKMVQRDKLDWYYSNNFDLIINRHFHKHFPLDIPNVWLPYSADEKMFIPKTKNRINKIGFVGSIAKWYVQRNKAICNLGSLIDNKGKVKEDKKYRKLLRSYSSMLTSSEAGSPFAKVFEIISSGTLLLTPPFGNSSVLFEPGCFIEYYNDCSNIRKKAEWIINNKEQAKKIAKKGRNIFLERHTDDLRIKELYDHITNILNGSRIVKYWGV